MASNLAAVGTLESSTRRPTFGSGVSWLERALALAAGTNFVIGVSAACTSFLLPRLYAAEARWALVLAVLGLAAAWSYSTFGGVLPSVWLARRRPLALAAGVIGFVAGLPLSIASGAAFVGGTTLWSDLFSDDRAALSGRILLLLAAVWALVAMFLCASLAAQLGALVRGWKLAFPRAARDSTAA